MISVSWFGLMMRCARDALKGFLRREIRNEEDIEIS